MRLIRLPALLLAGLLAGLAALVAAPGICLACSCATRESPAEALARADVVFRGRVTEVATERAISGYQFQRVTLRADTGWKGHVTREMRVYTGNGGGDCGYGFKQDEEYLVYAYVTRDDGPPQYFPVNALATGICTRTAPVSRAADDLAALGPGSPPADAPLPNLPNTGGGAHAVLGGVAALAVIVALPVGVLALRRRRA
jgi:LPXTG-motif cell wall-anchored protein